MESDLKIPITLRPSRLKLLLLLAVSSLFVIGGCWMVHDGLWFGYPVASFFALCSACFVVSFHPRASYLHLTPEGFTYCSLFRAHNVKWVDVREFGVISVADRQMVAWNFTSGYTASASGRSLSKSLSGYEAALPNTYGLKPHDLAQLMETLRERGKGGFT